MPDEVKFLIILTDGYLDYEVTKVELSHNNLPSNYTTSEEKIWGMLLNIEELQHAIKQILQMETFQLKRVVSYLDSSPPQNLKVNSREGSADGYIKVMAANVWLAICE